MIRYSSEERLEPREYIEFLTRTDLGKEYPRKAFHARIARLLRNADVCVTARGEDQRLVGVCLGLTDFAYFLFLTDLGVARDFARRGVGKTMVAMAHEAAGGVEDICSITWTNRAALAFYESCGMTPIEIAVGRHATDWTLFEVGPADIE